jgi:hypothetical protein
MRMQSKNKVWIKTKKIANELVVGDNVVVVCESFWLLLCDKHVHSVKKSYIND